MSTRPTEKRLSKVKARPRRANVDSAAMTRHALESVMSFLLATSHRMREVREHCAAIDNELRQQSQRRHGQAYKHSHALRSMLEHLLNLEVRVGDESACLTSLSPATHRFKGVWRPPQRPSSPEELECSAIICTCKVELRDAKQVKQHWQSGCFDCPEFERLPDGS